MSDKTEVGTDNAVTEDELLKFETPDVTESSNDFIDDAEESSTPELKDVDNAPDFRGRLDDKGVSFDPVLHSSPPFKTPSGRWKKIPKAQRVDDSIDSNNEYKADAEKIAMIYGNLHLLPFGVDGKIDYEALSQVTDSLEQYMIAHERISLPPLLNVLVSSAFYTTHICQRPNNKSKLLKWFVPFYLKIKSMLGFKIDDEIIEDENNASNG